MGGHENALVRFPTAGSITNRPSCCTLKPTIAFEQEQAFHWLLTDKGWSATEILSRTIPESLGRTFLELALKSMAFFPASFTGLTPASQSGGSPNLLQPLPLSSYKHFPQESPCTSNRIWASASLRTWTKQSLLPPIELFSPIYGT